MDFDSDFTAATPAQPAAFAGRFTATATTVDDELTVRVPWLDSTRTGIPVQWMPNGDVLPSKDDRAWVMEAVSEDGDGNEWIVVMWRPAS